MSRTDKREGSWGNGECAAAYRRLTENGPEMPGCYPDEIERLRKLCIAFFGRLPDRYEFLGLCGAPEGADLTLALRGDGLGIEFDARLPGPLFGECTIRRENALELRNDAIRLHRRSDRGRGIGLACFRRQIFWCKAFGFKRILAFAGRGGDENGYYTWPRFGFEADLVDDTGGRWRTLLELMSTPRGRAWWAVNGFACETVFDLSPGSPSMRALENYVAEKGLNTRSGRFP